MSAIIEVRNVWKEYRLGHESRPNLDNIREWLARAVKQSFRLKANPAESHFWALRDVGFDVQPGDVIGIIGRNGAGKSTLLKVLSRITDPTRGLIRLRGRMASLLEVGTGFHPELTGRENIFLNGAILGMRRSEINAKFDEMVAFSEIERFLDTPVKHYSSGMYVRLAFAVAAHLDPEILVVDEVLAVGDVAFQKKCLGKMSEVSHSGRTVLFVSHNMAAVEGLCVRGIVLQKGSVVFDGAAKDAVQQYLRSNTADLNSSHIVDISARTDRRSPQGPYLKQLELFTGSEPLTAALSIGSPLRLRVHFDLPVATDSFNVGIGFDNIYGQRVLTQHTAFEPDRSHGNRVGRQTFVCDIPELTLIPGEYSIRTWLDIGSSLADLVEDVARIRVVESDYYGTGRAPVTGTFVLRHRWRLEEQAEDQRSIESAVGAQR